ncbi:MAG TPA: metallophosphoesterase [Candidatus Omnitrophota bacterium]|nr:metallophosphoesterase [Candidatus Omnitrophota bacterium]HQJ15273.1 metallophosphoesterase [Candidatus Omnitrophota bacterium]
MRIGILSDTHDNLPAIKRAVDFFNQQKVQFVFHAGDFIAPFAIPYIDKLACDWRGVFGNNDGERQGLERASAGRIKEGILRVEIGNARIVMAHDSAALDIRQEKADIFVCGHTHKPEIAAHGNCLIVNPGEACGWLSGIATVAVADLDARNAHIHAI